MTGVEKSISADPKCPSKSHNGIKVSLGADILMIACNGMDCY